MIAEVKNAESIPVKGLLKGTIENISFFKRSNLNANETKEVTFSADEFPQLVMKKPRLWWPHTVGPQNLYDLNLSFEINGKISDSRETRFGVREISAWMNVFDSLAYQSIPGEWQEYRDPWRRLRGRHDAAPLQRTC